MKRFASSRLRRMPAVLIFLAATAFAAPPARIVSTAPGITEVLFALGLGDRVVGVTRFCLYPPEAQKLPKIGDYINPNLEAIAALKPDLAIVQANPIHLTERLKAMHLHTLEVDQQNLPLAQALYPSIRAIGEATGASARAAQLIETIRRGLDAVRARAAPLKPARVMFVVARSPGRLDGLTVVGSASYLNDVIAIAGGENIFRDALPPYPQVSLESVLARGPEVILDMGNFSDPREAPAVWGRAPSIAAVKQHRVFGIDFNMYTVPGPRVVDSARAMFAMFHPEAK